MSISRQQAQGLPKPVVEAILKADTSTLPTWVGVDLPNNGGYVLAKIEAVQAPSNQQPEILAARRQIEQIVQPTLSKAETAAFMAQLRSQYKAKITVAKPAAEKAAAQAGSAAEAADAADPS
jgi:peptidyl-prolyl cis-trans isomerase D